MTTVQGIGLGNPIDTPDPLNKYKWWILSGVGLVLVIAAAFFLRRSPQQDDDDAMVAASAQPAPVAEQYAKHLSPGVRLLEQATGHRGAYSTPATRGS